MKEQLRNKEGTLRQVREELTAATSELETLRPRAEHVEKELLIAQTDVSMQTALQGEAREQLHTKVAKLEEG